MDFALPGLLFGRQLFNDYYRNPIEKSRMLGLSSSQHKNIAPLFCAVPKAQVAKSYPKNRLNAVCSLG